MTEVRAGTSRSSCLISALLMLTIVTVEVVGGLWLTAHFLNEAAHAAQPQLFASR